MMEVVVTELHDVQTVFRLIQSPQLEIKSYLTDQTQIYTHAGSQTPCFSVDCRGSVFDPLGFASYTDLMDRHNIQFHLYADDT